MLLIRAGLARVEEFVRPSRNHDGSVLGRLLSE